jgi:hypothetical protein
MHEYLKEIINTIYETELTQDPADKMDSRLLEIWIDEIKSNCEIFYEDYLKGKRPSYYMTEEEYDRIFDQAGLQFSAEILSGLVDKNMVDVSVDEDGEIVYKLSETGNKLLNHIKHEKE